MIASVVVSRRVYNIGVIDLSMNLQSRQILYVDDEPENLNSFKLLFRRVFEIYVAQSADEALHILTNNDHIHVVVADQRMPEMSGVHFLKEVKSRWPARKRILLTGYSDNDAIKEAINEVGLFWYVNKPFDADQMELIINTAIETYHKEREKEFSDQTLREILATAPDAILTIDEDQHITTVNRAVLQLFGYDLIEDLIGHNLEILLPDYTENHDVLVNEFGISNDHHRSMQPDKIVHGKQKDGNLIPIEVAISKMELGDKVYYNAIIRDIRQRLSNEEKIRLGEERFKGVFDSLIDVYIQTDHQGICNIVSPSIQQVLLYEQDEIIGESITRICKREKDRILFFKKVTEQGKVRNFRFTALDKKGKVHVLSANSEAIIEHQEVKGYHLMLRDISDIVEAENEVEIHRERLATAVSAARLGVWDWDILANKLLWDHSMYELYGISEKDFDGEYDAWFSSLHPEDQERAENEADQALSGEKDYNTEFRIVRPNGSIRIIRSVATVIRNDSGKPIRMIGCNWDLTDEKEAQRKLIENNVLFRESEKMAHFGIWRWNTVTNDVEFSAELFKIFGIENGYNRLLTLDEVLTFMHPDDRGRIVQITEEAIKAKELSTTEYRIVRGNGAVRMVKSWGGMIEDGSQPDTFFGMIWDITDMKLKELALRTSEAEFRSLSESSPNVIIKINNDYQIEYINQEQEEKVFGKSIFTWFPEYIQAELIQVLDKVFETGRPSSFEAIHYSSNEDELWYSVNVAPIDKQGRVENLILVATDITSRMEMEQEKQRLNDELEEKVKQRTKELLKANVELEQAKEKVIESLNKERELSELKSRFVSTASHQFRTPLTVIHSNIDLLEMSMDNLKVDLKQRFEKSFSRIKDETNRMTELMNDVLVLGKVNAGAIKLVLSEIKY